MIQPKADYILPDDFIEGVIKETNIIFYESTKSSQKNKENFTQNLLCFLIEGQKEVFSGKHNFSFTNENILLIPSGNTLMTEKINENSIYKSINLFFSDNFLTNYLVNKSKYLSKEYIDSPILIIKDEYIINFEKSLLLLQEKSERTQNLIEIKFEEIFSYLSHKHSSLWDMFVCAILNRSNDLPFRQVITQQEDFNLSVDELAFLCNMSISTFKRKFSEVFNASPKQYFIQKKMNHAMALLQSNKRPSEIFIDLGYQNLSAFSNEFKKHFGFSPKEHTNQV